MGKFVNGNNAYVCSETLLNHFSGVEKDELIQDAHNFDLLNAGYVLRKHMEL